MRERESTGEKEKESEGGREGGRGGMEKDRYRQTTTAAVTAQWKQKLLSLSYPL